MIDEPAAGISSIDPSSFIAPLMQPKSVAIIGASTKPGSLGVTVLRNLATTGFAGDIHLVGRGGGEIDGRPVLTEFTELPKGIDLAILVVPAAAVRETVLACVAHGVRSAVSFASGFGETGEAGRLEQAEIGRICREGGLALIGPNCIGYTSFVDGFSATLLPTRQVEKLPPEAGPALAVITQSGGIGYHVAESLRGRGVPISHLITTGNEAHLGTGDFISYLIDQPQVAGVVAYAEHIQRPGDVLAAAAKGRLAGKPVLLLHPGRSEKAQSAAASHTGAMAGNYAVMRTVLEDAGVLMVDTLEELIDLAQLTLRYPKASVEGMGLVTMSGAICALTQDYCDALGLDVPPMSAPQAEALRPSLANYTPPKNPLDLGTLTASKPDLLREGTAALLSDPAIGSVLMSLANAQADYAILYAQGIVAHRSHKPIVCVIHDEDRPIHPEAQRILVEGKTVLIRSPERGMRALARLTSYAKSQARARRPAAQPFDGLPQLGRGPQPEWLGKKVLAAMGLPVPAGGMASSLDEAQAIAARIGYPVVIKAQAAELTHKSEVGGVIIKIADAAALSLAWERLHASVGQALPNLKLDGILVEAMGAPGVELVVGGRRDPLWGPVLLVGLGGVWMEALGDFRLLPATLAQADICEELTKLKGAKLLGGFRGSAPVDIAAVARAAAAIGRLLVTTPQIVEIDINPLVARADGVSALDCLIVTE